MKKLLPSSKSNGMAANNCNVKKRRKESSQEAVPKKQKKNESAVDMPRPIQDGGDDGAAVEEKENSRVAEKSDSVNDVIQMMKTPQSRNMALKKFSALCHDDDDDHAKAGIAVYLRTSPECKEFFQLLEGEERPGTQETKLIWNAFEGILLVTASSGSSNLEAISLYVVNKILNKHVKLLYSGLNPSGPADLIKSVLKLLTVILTQGKKCVSELLSTFDFTLKALMLLPKKRDNKGQADVRTYFLKFYIAFFIFGDLNAIKEVLELQVFTNGVVNGILKDTPQMIHLILSTLNEKVLKEKSFLKKTKLAFFNKHTLTQLAHLYVQIQNKGDNERTELHEEINVLVMEMLEVICTDSTFGILFPNKQGIFAGRSNNPVLLSFVKSIQKLAVTEPKLRELMSKTFAAAPDLIIPVFSKLGVNLEPRDSEPWRNNMGFLMELWSNIPPIASLLKESEQEITMKNLSQSINVIFPTSLNKVHLANGLKQQSLTVKQKTTDLILVCLERALSMHAWITHSKQTNGTLNHIGLKLADQLCELVLKQLPDVRAFITARDKNKKDVSSSGADEKSEDVDMSQNNDSRTAATDSEKVALENSLVDVLVYFQHLRPGIMTTADFNVCKLFKIDDTEDLYDSKMLMNALKIALMEPEGNLKWLSKKSELQSNAVNLVFNTYTKSSLPDMKQLSHRLIIGLIDEAGSITENKDEMESWLEALSQAKDPSLAIFFKQMCIMAVQESYSILDELIETTTMYLDEDDEMEASSLDRRGRSELSPLTIAAFRCFVKRTESEKDHQCLTSLSLFITKFLTDALMLQENPLALFRVIEKYIPLAKESLVGGTSDSLAIWNNFESFANVWCTPVEVQDDKEVNPDDVLDLDNKISPTILLPKLREEKADSFTAILHTALSLENHGRRISDQKGFATELTDRIRANLSQNSTRRLTKYTRICLNYINKLTKTNNGDCLVLLALLENLITESKKSKEAEKDPNTLLSNQIGNNGRKEMSPSSESRIDIVRIVLESPVVKELFLGLDYLVMQNDLRDLINVAIKNLKHEYLTGDIAFYVNKISERIGSILEDLDVSTKEEVDDWGGFLITNLEIFSLFMTTESRENLVKNLVELLLKDKNDLVVRYDSFLEDLNNIMLTSINLLLKPPVRGNLPISKKVNKEVDPEKTAEDGNGIIDATDEQTPKTSPLQQINLSPKSIAGLFTLSQNNDSQRLSEVILSMLEMDVSIAMSAPTSIIDVYLRRNTQASLQTVELLAYCSPVHAMALRSKFGSGFDGLPISAVIRLVYSLLMVGSEEFRKETIDAVKSSYYSTFMSVLTDANKHSEHSDEDYKMLSQILMVMVKNTDMPLLADPNIKLLHKSLKAIRYSTKTAVKLRCQIELFYNCVGREMISMKKSTVLLESLVYLMKVWGGFMASKDQEGHKQLELTLHKAILELSQGLCARKKTNPNDELLALLAENWSSLVRICLKHCIDCHESMDVIANLVSSLYSIKKFRKNSSLTLETIYQYLLSHSRFLPILLEEEYDAETRDALIGLLLAIAQQETKVCKASHIKAFMTAYNATLSSTDQKLLLLLRIYEDNGASILSMKPLKWGKKALEHRKEKQGSHTTLNSQTSMKDVMESLDRNLLVKSAFNFPLVIDVTKNADVKQLKPIRDDVYDPSFLLPLFSHFLTPVLTEFGRKGLYFLAAKEFNDLPLQARKIESRLLFRQFLDSHFNNIYFYFEVDCRKFIDIGCLAFVIAALSSQHIATRKTAYHVLARFMNQLEGSRFLEKTQIVVLLDSLKNSVIEEGMVIPSIICSFALRCLQILLRPDQHLYEVVNHFLLHKPYLDVKDVPLFLNMLNSSSLQFNAERGWILKLLASGLRTSADYYIYKRRHVFEQIMALYDSPMCDATAKKSICEVITAASHIHNAAFDLVKTHGLISWIQNRLTSSKNDQQIDFVLQILINLVKTFSKGFEVVGDDGNKETKKPIPLNFQSECSSVCLVIVEKYRDVLKLQQLDSLTGSLEWCISTEPASQATVASTLKGDSEDLLEVTTEEAPALQKKTIFIPHRHIKQLIEIADSHVRRQTVVDQSLDEFYENIARITMKWLERQSLLMKHGASGMPAFIVWICCEYMKHITNNHLGLLIFEIVTAILSRAAAMLLQEDWIYLLKAHEQLLEKLLQNSLELCCRVHHQFLVTDEFFVYSFLSKSYGELRSAALLLLNSVMCCVYIHGSNLKSTRCSNIERDNLKDRDMLFHIYSKMKSDEYKEILKKTDFKNIATCEQKGGGEQSINMSNEKLPQSLQVLLVEILAGKDSPEQFLKYCQIVGTTGKKENREE